MISSVFWVNQLLQFWNKFNFFLTWLVGHQQIQLCEVFCLFFCLFQILMNVKCTECVVKIVKTPREATSVYVKQVINWSLIRKRVKRKVIFLLVIFLCVLMNSNCLWDYGVFMGLKNVYVKFSCCHISCGCWLGSSAHPQMCLFWILKKRLRSKKKALLAFLMVKSLCSCSCTQIIHHTCSIPHNLVFTRWLWIGPPMHSV